MTFQPNSRIHTTERPAVLFVEDDQVTREAVQLILEGAGYDVVTACHGRQALALLDRMVHTPVVVLTDLMMPVMDGLQFVRRLRGRRRFSRTPVLLISGSGQHLPEKVLARLDRYLPKPVPPARLLDAVAQLTLRSNRVKRATTTK